ncbi:MAG: hypothetical protein MK060_15655 [Blastomonas sp.]|uniref:hypothetical protein n=1 Tax=Blastomonas sp. TaxID=1909299 RepID=UPI00406A5F71|nr:hypothetical protein [Blastomonas sp.]
MDLKELAAWFVEALEGQDSAFITIRKNGDHLSLNRYTKDVHAEEVERLRAALKPFADCCDQIADDEDDEEWAKFRLLIKDYRAARNAFTGRA